MMVIRTEGLGKKFLIRHEARYHYDTLREALVRTVKETGNRLVVHPLKRLCRGGGKENGEDSRKSRLQDFWALRDISFDVNQGDRIGIIGHNGSGKSTLFKILSRITGPTEGKFKVRGRVACLLEVGTGFHPELTGKENIYLNGAVLGMTRADIRKKFDAIVSFAEVEDFLDTPLKRYSTGMNVRLAFSVAAHLDAEIMLVDEVLAVGDARFQKKCLAKMAEFSTEGRTVVFVSHDMNLVSSFCERCLLLQAGRIAKDGKTSEVISHYYSSGGSASPSCIDFSRLNRIIGDEDAVLLSAYIVDKTGAFACEVGIEEAFTVGMRFRILRQPMNYRPNLHFHSAFGVCAFVAMFYDVETLHPEDYTVECHIPGRYFNDGTYFIDLALTSFDHRGVRVHFWQKSALSLSVRDPVEETRLMPGVVRPHFHWTLKDCSRV